MQRILIVYDISEDKVRAKVADACLDYGLDRLQYSVFEGSLSRNHQEELMLLVDELLLEANGSVVLFPLTEDNWQRRLEVVYA